MNYLVNAIIFLNILSSFAENRRQNFNFKIFFINLDRREERRRETEAEIQSVFPNVAFQRFSAIDAQQLSEEDLVKLGARTMPGYLDPYSKRPMKMGEVACFLSHYFLWAEIVTREIPLALILEDDAQFITGGVAQKEPFNFHLFHFELNKLLLEFSSYNGDLLYLGRKLMSDNVPCDHCDYLVRPGYSYWTVAYLLTLDGAKKLLSTNILSSVVPVDEYLPLMYGQNPFAENWKHSIFAQNKTTKYLSAFSAKYLLVQPRWFPSDQEMYVSDTENSQLVQNDCCHEQKYESTLHRDL